jgi:hypothetical protein
VLHFSFTESVDISLEDPARSREALQTALERVNNELSGLKKLWTAERQNLMGEKAMLRDTANKLTTEVKAESAKVERERKRAKEAAKQIQDEGERQRAIMQAVGSSMQRLDWTDVGEIHLCDYRSLTMQNARFLPLRRTSGRNERNCVL